MEIVFAQDEPQRLHGKKISATRITQNVSPPSRFLDLVTAASRHGRTAAGVDRNSIGVTERGRQTRVAIAAGNNFRSRPDFRAKARE